ncbi:aldo/keto reductase [Mesorhizobium sp. AR10]|uniref:aldo/keto reductase n=1 Tax=Mesorhizobium sp. AR10 TaxID=2865839 RepID=UPI0021601E7A|nr:aldo/keto reductase [Mesorhizobium sp. AR10]UVK38872.1 aldo/keto reductase [Mesorhizobium sp. AR10]
MKNRPFGRLGRNVSEIGFGSWGIGGGQWVEVEENQALAALDAALDLGVTFIDTADVYGDGRSEKLIAKVLKRRGGPRPFIATKLGKRLPSQVVSGYTLENMKGWVQRSLDFLETDALDLVQLHCPPTDLYYHQEVFAALDEIVASGRLKAYGVSVERIEEALKAIEFPNVASVQIIFNILRQRPIDLFFEQARNKNVAVIARVPLASGLLSGKFKPDSQFDKADHRNFNRNGEAFDVGETFSGMPYDKGLEVIERIRPLVGSVSMAQFALRWILMFDAVTVVIPGARTAEQARSNSQAAALPALSPEVMAQLKKIYETDVKPFVHQRW